MADQRVVLPPFPDPPVFYSVADEAAFRREVQRVLELLQRRLASVENTSG